MTKPASRPFGIRLDRQFARHRGKLILLFWLAVGFTLIMALLPKPPVLPGEPTDKIQHILAFITLTILSLIAAPWWRGVQRILLLSSFGALIELLQAIPSLHRSSDSADWLADTVAVVITFGIATLLHRWLVGEGSTDL